MKKDHNIIIEYYRSRGPGGQRKNKKETAVRVRHISTGITAVASESRSQAANRQVAVERLRRKLKKLSEKKKPRIPTKTPPAVKSEILKQKKIRSETKQRRQKVGNWDEGL